MPFFLSQEVPPINIFSTKKHGIKNLVGAWLSDDLDKNELEIEGLIQLAKEGCVDIGAVDNEVMYRKDLTEEHDGNNFASGEKLIDSSINRYKNRVKNALKGMDIPIGYVDAYYEFSHRPNITEACDVILSNCYPYWEGCSIEHSLKHMQDMFRQAIAAGNGKKVIITETGWPSKGESLKGAHSTEENAMKYFVNSQDWANKAGIEIFYFSSFYESWKVGAEGVVGAYWGLWDKHEELKF